MSEIIRSEGSVKLYEYEQIKPELADDYIEHFGILGMHWGQRNGPPYPLGSDKSTGRRLKKSEGKIARKRRKALKKARKTRARNLKIRTLEKKQQEKLQKSKEEIIKSKDINSMLKNVDKFTNQEINDLLGRLDVESKLRSRVNAMNEANKSFVAKFLTAVKKEATTGIVSAGKNLVRKGSEEGFKVVSKRLLEEMVNPNMEAGDGRTWGEIINAIYGQGGKKGKKKSKRNGGGN